MKNKQFSNVNQWLGIPYAKANRFQKPELLSFDPNGQYNQSGPASLQNFDISWLNTDKGASEDSLNLNVWSPAHVNEKLPVVVYIHGGGFEYGANSQDTSDLSGMVATEKVVGVSINYRLGIFGWLSLTQYGEPFKETTNLGLQDVITALQWVKQNIEQFGGDPNNITVEGHSAGAFISTALLSAPSAKGLFNRLLLFSSSAARIIPRWWAEELAHKVIVELGIQDTPEQLIKMDAKTLMSAFSKVQPRGYGETHGIDNKILGTVDDSYLENGIIKAHPLEVLANGEHKDVDIVFSTTTAEVDWYAINTPDAFRPESFDELVEELIKWSKVPRSRAVEIVKFYAEGRSPIEAKSLMYTDFCFLIPASRGALAHAKSGGRAYLLNVGPTENNPAVHGTEMYGIVGQKQPDATEEQIKRDQIVTDTVYNLTYQNYDLLWQPVTNKIYTKDIGQRPYEGTTYTKRILELFRGIDRP
ncbi:carboxylesterase/lipase family protein [Priestia megaterium]|uniref:Carboxylic ester hydrolase n=1 Tax=Priestia megaterium TaxID=1404 RepID=A0A3D8WUK2_PRIMG|nr:carboxylesterase family protein [Priestia megaterium]MDH3169148.1 carboxylesterase family protein [Priestia megaterium]MDH3169195.1 carboxylesterase family protein [Priestia megaterium]RDZ07678.1 carboxylesterase/lipase family protein [Priestia megaterium]